jgi:hypothetical protein
LQHCARCRAIVTRVGNGEPAQGDLISELEPTKAAGQPPKAGGVWTFWAPKSDEYLVGAVLEAGDEDLLLMPLLADVSWAAESDLLLSSDVLGYPALALIWAGDHVLLEQAVEPVGMLSEERLARLERAYDAFYGGEPLEDPAGPPVRSDEDPRPAAHAARADSLRVFYEPWAQLQAADELGPVLRARREEFGIDVHVWPERLDVDRRAWLAFEQAEADPSATVPVKALARALDELELLASRRVLALAGASVREHYVPVIQATEHAKARRRSGVRPRPRPDPAQANAAAEQYMEHLAKELGL